MGRFREDRWQHLCLIAEQIQEIAEQIEAGRSNEDSLKQVASLLDSVVEVFPRELDPTIDFEGYSIRQFAKGLSAWSIALLRKNAGKL